MVPPTPGRWQDRRMGTGSTSPDVVDDGVGRFTVRERGATAELVYLLEDGELVLVHTGVPDEIGGHGIGGALVRAAVRRARDEGLTIVPLCPYARRWLREHPDVAGTVPIDWAPIT